MKSYPIAFALSLFVFGCGAPITETEPSRETVLHYLGGDYGTVGPFNKERKKELDVLAPDDRKKAAALLDQGALGFSIYQPGAADVARIILVQKDKVVGDFQVKK